MPSIQNIKGSDGTTETVRAVVTAQRAVSSTTIAVNSIVGFNSKFIGTTGGLDADNELTIRPQVFFGHISGSNLVIDSFAPGYTDQGNEVGDIVVIKPTTAWADEVASTLAVVHNDNGTLKNNSVTTSAVTDASITTAKLANGAVTAGKIDFGGAGVGVWWEEIGRTTLTAVGDTITVSSLPARKYIKVIYSVYDVSGTINLDVRFNSDSGNNYSVRASANGNAADGTALSANSFGLSPVTDTRHNYGEFSFDNVVNREKFIIGNTTSSTQGASNAMDRRLYWAKWSNTTALVSSISFINTVGTGNYEVGSEIVVLGHN